MIETVPTLRLYRPDDLDSLYRICLETGDGGQDATTLYRDPKILGQVYAAPYAVYCPDSTFVVEDPEGVAGYILGPADTHAFEKTLESEWWPQLRGCLPGTFRTADPDERMAWIIHHPPRTPRRISEPWPAHLHINLLPRFQGRASGPPDRPLACGSEPLWCHRSASGGRRAKCSRSGVL